MISFQTLSLVELKQIILDAKTVLKDIGSLAIQAIKKLLFHQ